MISDLDTTNEQAGNEAIRGLMLDVARLTERHEFYFGLFSQLAQWGCNTVWWHFCDDEGFALELDNFSELASPYAFTKAEMRELVKQAASVNIDLVPEVESLGHALAITSQPQYAHLFNGSLLGHNALCPSHPDTAALIRGIIGEVVEIFGSTYIHAGLDEADVGDCQRCAERSRNKPEWWLFAEHAKTVHEIIRSHGRKMIMWADAVEEHPELLDALPGDIVLAHWHYGHVPVEKVRPSARAGFKTVCVAAISNQMIQPGSGAFKNIDANAALTDELSAAGSLGMVTAWWESHRHLRDTYPLAVMYAMQAMRTREPEEPASFVSRAAVQLFGISDDNVADALWQTHEQVPEKSTLRTLYPTDLAAVFRAAEHGGTRCEQYSRAVEELTKSVQTFDAFREEVWYNRVSFRAYDLSAQIIRQAYRNALSLRRAVDAYEKAADHHWAKAPASEVAACLKNALNILEEQADNVDRLARAADVEWDRTRHPDDDKKDNSSSYMRRRGTDNLLARLQGSARFLRQLADRLRDQIDSYNGGGPFPGGTGYNR